MFFALGIYKPNNYIGVVCLYMFMAEAGESAFNAGIEYLRTITTYEREIGMAFFKDDYDTINKGLDVLYMELAEWFTKEELTEQTNIRTKQRVAHRDFQKLRNAGKTEIPTEIIDVYKDRFMILKKVVHAHSLRMAKKEDMNEDPEEW